MRPRRAILTAFVVLNMALAGCTAFSGGETTTVESTTPSTTTTTATTAQSTVGSSAVSDSDAKERALSAEETYLSTQLSNPSCIEDWGTTPTTMDKEATVVNRTAEGVVVDVLHPYSYSTNSSEADLGSNARYLVTENNATRVSGDNIAPC